MTDMPFNFTVFIENICDLFRSTIYLKSLNILKSSIIYWRIWRMDDFYKRSALLGFMKYNKPQINADERRSKDVSDKILRVNSGVSTVGEWL